VYRKAGVFATAALPPSRSTGSRCLYTYRATFWVVSKTDLVVVSPAFFDKNHNLLLLPCFPSNFFFLESVFDINSSVCFRIGPCVRVRAGVRAL
jgi:hypothetical protein